MPAFKVEPYEDGFMLILALPGHPCKFCSTREELLAEIATL